LIKIASDLDGVISTIQSEWFIDKIVYNIFGSYWGWFRHRKCKPLYSHHIDWYSDIITGRPESDRWYTEDWLRKYHIPYKNLIMNDIKTMNEEKVAEWKALKIRGGGYNLYYDDNPLVVEKLAGIINIVYKEFYKRKYRIFEVEIIDDRL
jgi:hypothetical protein